MTALKTQIGGNHYSTAAMQPVELAAQLNLNGFELFIVKYLSRHRSKGGVNDVLKAKHMFELMHELEVNRVRWWHFWRPLINAKRVNAVDEYCAVNHIGHFERELMIKALTLWHPSQLDLIQFHIDDCFDYLTGVYQ